MCGSGKERERERANEINVFINIYKIIKCKASFELGNFWPLMGALRSSSITQGNHLFMCECVCVYVLVHVGN